MQNIQKTSKPRNKTFDLVITAMLAALAFVSTSINIKLPFGEGGLIHLGTVALFIASILFGPKIGALAGAIGMGLFDLSGEWAAWAPITIVARLLQGYIVGKIAWSKGRNGNSVALNIVATIVSAPVMIGAYYIGSAIMNGNWISPAASIPGDVIQNVVGIAIAIPLTSALKKTAYFKNM